MPIIGTVGSSYYVPPVYALSETFNASGTYTVPAGTSKIAIVGVGAGGGGAAGNSARWNTAGTIGSGAGGGGGGLFSVREISATPGETYTVTIGAGGIGGYTKVETETWLGNSGSSGGVTNFGNILTANGGSGGGRAGVTASFNGIAGSGGTIVYNSGTADASTTGATGGAGSTSAVFPTYTTPDGAAGSNSSSINSNDANITLYSGGGGGGGASRALAERYNAQTYIGSGAAGAAGSPYGGAGGTGGNLGGYNYVSGQAREGNRGANATGRGGGGGGGGGSSFGSNLDNNPGYAQYSYQFSSSTTEPYGAGGYGSSAQILVYAK